MLRVTKILDVVETFSATITLDETARHRRRMVMRADQKSDGIYIQFLLDLSAARLLQHGNGLVLDNGAIIKVHAKPETLYEVRGQNPHHLLRLCWQLGNRHLASQIMDDHIRIQANRVIKNMLQGLGADIVEIEAAFNPEGGAYHGHKHDE